MKKLLLAIALFLIPVSANAATCFWVGGTGSWSTSNTASWASASGGTTGTCAATGGVPKQAADIATFDGSSGGGTVTVDSTINNITLTNLNATTFTGTLDFNNQSMTFSGSVNLSGSSARKYLMGTGTFTFTGTGTLWDLGTTTNLDPTSDFSAATFVFSATTGTSRTFIGGGRTYGTLTVAANTSRGAVALGQHSNTFNNINLAAGTFFSLPPSVTQTITNAPTWAGTSSNPITLLMSNFTSSNSSLSVATGTLSCTWCAIYKITGTGGATFSATNSFDLGGNSGITITAPTAGGGGGKIIGG